MSDFSWLASEAKQLHGVFQTIFFSLVGLLLVIGVVMEYFQLYLGKLPAFATLVSRAFIATILLVSFQEFIHVLADLTDAVANRIGGLNEFHLVLDRMGGQLDKMSWSWTSAKQMVIVTISFLSFFLLYISVYLSDALYLYTWTILYVFSPFLIALFVLPITAGATKALYRSLFMVSFWKIIWSVMATLLWSAALMDLQKLETESSFLTIIMFNVMLAASLLLTPLIAGALLGRGMESASSQIAGWAMAGASLGASRIMQVTKLGKAPGNAATYFKERFQRRNYESSLKAHNQKMRPENTGGKTNQSSQNAKWENSQRSIQESNKHEVKK